MVIVSVSDEQAKAGKRDDMKGAAKKQMPDGTWAPARPIPGPFIWEARRRLLDAWLILTGKAFAVRWY